MAKNRSIKELLILLRDNSRVEKGLIKSGLCNEARHLRRSRIITIFEYHILDEYVSDNIEMNVMDGFGWKPTLWRPRLEWLNNHIMTLK